jgi:hypothetical protein
MNMAGLTIGAIPVGIDTLYSKAKAREAGFVRADQDARVLMGQELISVFVVIDIARFLGPDEAVRSEPKSEAKKGAKR